LLGHYSTSSEQKKVIYSLLSLYSFLVYMLVLLQTIRTQNLSILIQDQNHCQMLSGHEP